MNPNEQAGTAAVLVDEKEKRKPLKEKEKKRKIRK